MIIREEDYIAHIGTPRHSGRYPWGSGGDPYQRNKSFLDYVDTLQKQGMSAPDIARGMGMNTTELRAKKSIAKNAQKQADIGQAQRLHDLGMSNIAVGLEMNRNESSVRALLEPGAKDKADLLQATASKLRSEVDKKSVIQIGTGVETQIGVSNDRLKIAVAILKEEGYRVHNVQAPQLGTSGNKTTVKVLARPGIEYKDIVSDLSMIQMMADYSPDGGRTFLGLVPPIQIDSKRVAIRYSEQGGDAADGVIFLRPGAKDLSLGAAHYAQVRIAVDGSHYLKGMAMFKDDLPKGVDLMFNTNKSDTGNKLDAMKPMKIDQQTGKIDKDNPFGSVVHQLPQLDANGKEIKDTVRSALNIVYGEGEWDVWNKNLSSQMLSKQSPRLAETQLAKVHDAKVTDLNEIMTLTNPTVRKKLLETFANEADSSAVHLKAAHLDRQGTHVILPISTLKENEIYAPNFINGERVVLIRFPHGGPFEIPELTVNNKHPQAKKILGNAMDAVGINSAVAKRLSGADFDGDTVVVIPNNAPRKIKTSPPLPGLLNFDPQSSYPKYNGMTPMTAAGKGYHMGVISNLITDMNIKKASSAELARAVRHSMVVIDAEKHKLNYKQSAIDNNIRQLKVKYQNGPNGGGSTLISQRKSRFPVNKRIARRAQDGGPIDPATGKKVFVPTNESYIRTTVNEKTGEVTKKVIFKKQVSTKLAETDNAHTLSSGTPIETVYADHSNSLKALANKARKELIRIKPTPYSESAKKAYTTEVASLNASLNLAIKNRPLERQAQILAKSVVDIKIAANPDMDKTEIKRLNFLALAEMRRRTGAKRQVIDISLSEWHAIQAGAITNHKLEQILDKADLKRVRELATPRVASIMTPSKIARANSMIARGATRAEIAQALGVSLSTLKSSLTK